MSRRHLRPILVRGIAILAVLIAAAVPISSAQAVPVYPQSQYFRGQLSASYSALQSFTALVARVDYRSPSGIPTVAPKVGERFLVHAETAITYPESVSGTSQVTVLLPAGVQSAISSLRDVQCYITDSYDQKVGTCINGALPKVSPRSIGGQSVAFGTEYISGNSSTHVNQALHWIFPVTATKTINGPIGCVVGSTCFSQCTGSTCIELTSYISFFGSFVSPNPIVALVPLKVGATTVPSAPRSVGGSPRNAAAVVSWLPPASNGGLAITRYQVTASPGGRTCLTTGARTCTVTGLTNRTAYSFQVRALNAKGWSAASSWSPQVVVGTPTAPRAMKVTFPAAGAIRLTWVGPASLGSGPVIRYEQRARGHAAGSSTWTAWQPSPTTWAAIGKGLVYSDSGYILGATYQFQIRAVNGSGAGAAASLVFVQAK